MDLLEPFVAQYKREVDFYDQVARMAARKLDAALQAEGIRAIVTSRAKSVARLRAKIQQRNFKVPYTSIEDIYQDIVDLAGVRIALYFPGEREQVGRLVSRMFYEYEPRKVFRTAGNNQTDNRFSGYSAIHYRVRISQLDLDESEQRYAAANIEIQVASVLMHAWSEVAHDLVYKPSQGELSDEEHSLLDQLNGLVLAGEISLEQLQRAGKARIARTDRQFANHYELAAHLLSSASDIDAEEVTEEGIGRVDVLFALLKGLHLGTPSDLQPYLRLLHGDLERRPLAEQIVDALLAEEPERYEIFRKIRQASEAKVDGTSTGHEIYREVGLFLEQWVQLEQMLRKLAPTSPKRPVRMPSFRLLEESRILDSDTQFELDQLRRMRNQLVHGIEIPSPEHLHDATERIERLIQQLNERYPPP